MWQWEASSKIVSDRFSMKTHFLRTPFSFQSGSDLAPAKMINAIGEPKVLYNPDLFSVHGAPPGNSFVQNITNPICNVLHEGFFSNASPGRDQIVEACRRGPMMAGSNDEGTEG